MLIFKDNSQQELLVPDMLGIFTERDYLTKIAVKGLSSRNVNIQDVMSKNVETVHAEMPLVECMQLAVSRNLRHFPVVSKTSDGKSKVECLISIKDIIRYILEEQMSSKAYVDETFKNL